MYPQKELVKQLKSGYTESLVTTFDYYNVCEYTPRKFHAEHRNLKKVI